MSYNRRADTHILQRAVIASVVVAFILWFVTFNIRPFNFWLLMTINTVLLSAVSFYYGGFPCRFKEFNTRNIALGILSAAVLYGVFWVGHNILVLINEYTGLLPQRAENLNSIYANKGNVPPALVGMLLVFPIGFGEEIYWRGFVQRYFQGRQGKWVAFIITVVLYTGVHVPTANPVLILAAFICGIFWGGLYVCSGSLVPVLISHMVWDPFIFIIFPIR